MRRRLAIFWSVSVLTAATVFACSSESPIIVIEADAAPSLVADSGPAAVDRATPPPTMVADAAPDGRLFDGGDPDALITRDAGAPVDADGCQTCDCDLDGFDRPGCGDDAGEDCDDQDTRYRPNQSFVPIAPDPGKSADWNCRFGVEKLFPTNVDCALLNVSGCGEAEGFEGDPPCGQPGKYVKCAPVLIGLLCQTASSETKTQACR